MRKGREDGKRWMGGGGWELECSTTHSTGE
jgi:hypothetical protein